MANVQDISDEKKAVVGEKNEGSVKQVEELGGKNAEMEYHHKHVTRQKWLALFALGVAYMTAVQQGACIGMIVKSIDIALGPTTYYNWLLSAGSISSTISLPLAGGLSDIFGRRWFMIFGAVIHLVAGIIALTAQHMPQMIVATIISGFGSGPLFLSLAAAAELVENRHRGIMQAVLDLMALPWSIFGALTGGAMIAYHGPFGFRINFIIGIVLNSISAIILYVAYHPPSTGGNLMGRTKTQAVKDLDWTGIFLLNSSIILFLVATSCGGTTWAWKSAPILTMIPLSIALMGGFAYWEVKCAKYPFFAKELFQGQGRTFTMFLVIDFFMGGVHAAIAFWAQAVRGIWNADVIKVGILCIPGGIGGAAGGFAAGMLIGKAKMFKSKYILVFACAIKVMSDFAISNIEPHGRYGIPFGLGMGFISTLGNGLSGVALIVSVQLSCKDKDLGLATLLLSAVQNIGNATAVTVYSTIINNKLKRNAGRMIYQATVPLGMDPKKLKPFIDDLINEHFVRAGTQPGVTPEILLAGREALKRLWADAFHIVYKVAAGFVVAALIAALWSKDVTHNMTNHIAVHLENDPDTEKDEEMKGKEMVANDKGDEIKSSDAKVANESIRKVEQTKDEKSMDKKEL